MTENNIVVFVALYQLSIMLQVNVSIYIPCVLQKFVFPIFAIHLEVLQDCVIYCFRVLQKNTKCSSIMSWLLSFLDS